MSLEYFKNSLQLLSYILLIPGYWIPHSFSLSLSFPLSHSLAHLLITNFNCFVAVMEGVTVYHLPHCMTGAHISISLLYGSPLGVRIYRENQTITLTKLLPAPQRNSYNVIETSSICNFSCPVACVRLQFVGGAGTAAGAGATPTLITSGGPARAPWLLSQQLL